MNQGKLEMVKQEMARVNVDILGISKLKWTGMGEFNSGDHYIYYCRQESLRRNRPNPRKRQRVKKYIGFSPDISSSVPFQCLPTAKTAGSPMSEEMSFTGVRNLGH